MLFISSISSRQSRLLSLTLHLEAHRERSEVPFLLLVGKLNNSKVHQKSHNNVCVCVSVWEGFLWASQLLCSGNQAYMLNEIKDWCKRFMWNITLGCAPGHLFWTVELKALHFQKTPASRQNASKFTKSPQQYNNTANTNPKTKQKNVLQVAEMTACVFHVSCYVCASPVFN